MSGINITTGAGRWENRYGYVTLIEKGRLVRLERYEPEASDAMLARYEHPTAFVGAHAADPELEYPPPSRA
ncbi:MAG: hypothetical protein ACRDNK_13075 [Solirubrobacteraceae bacterium]